MSRAKTWALLAGMTAGLAVGPGCMMFDELCDDDYECSCDGGYFPEFGSRPIEHISPGNDAQTYPAVPDR